jgi:DNA-binding response OmpR family regulator
MRILLVEDDLPLALGLQQSLRHEGFVLIMSIMAKQQFQLCRSPSRFSYSGFRIARY